jgi:hypothetical protein
MTSCNRMICEVGHIASRDLVSEENMPIGLYSLLTEPDPFVARAAAEAAYELIYEHERFESAALKPFIQIAAVHPHWWVRYWSAQNVWRFSSFRLINRLLSDPCGAVAAATASFLNDEDFPSSSTALKLCRTLSQKSPHDAVYVSMVFQRTREYWRNPNMASKLCQVLLSSNQHLRIKEEMENCIKIARKLSNLQLLKVSAEELLLWLYVGEASVLSVSQLSWIARKHPDPIARQVALEAMSFHLLQGEDCEQVWLTLAQAMQDENPSVRLSAAKSVSFLDEENYPYLIEPLMRLTHDPCLRIVQVAIRSMRGCCDIASEMHNPVVVNRLLALLTHPDPLVRINTLYTLQDYPLVPPKVVKVVQDLWAKEGQSMVRAAIAKALWWLMPLKDWLPVYGVALANSGRKDWRHLAKSLFRMSEFQEAVKAVDLLQPSAAKHFFRRLLKTHIVNSVKNTLSKS